MCVCACELFVKLSSYISNDLSWFSRAPMNRKKSNLFGGFSKPVTTEKFLSQPAISYSSLLLLLLGGPVSFRCVRHSVWCPWQLVPCCVIHFKTNPQTPKRKINQKHHHHQVTKRFGNLTLALKFREKDNKRATSLASILSKLN